MKGDIQEVATSKAIETDVINKFKLANFEDGLRMHGSPDYLRDYCKPNPS
jgi:hypothetical protein